MDRMDTETLKSKVIVKACRFIRDKKAKSGTRGLAREIAQSRIVESEHELAEAVEKLENRWAEEAMQKGAATRV
jgi:hypothetical protein